MSAVKAIIGQRLIPWFPDRYLARKAWDAQTTLRLPAGHPISHVDAPVPGDKGAHGPFDAEAAAFKRAKRARLVRLAAAFGVLGLALGGLAILRRAAAGGPAARFAAES